MTPTSHRDTHPGPYGDQLKADARISQMIREGKASLVDEGPVPLTEKVKTGSDPVVVPEGQTPTAPTTGENKA